MLMSRAVVKGELPTTRVRMGESLYNFWLCSDSKFVSIPMCERRKDEALILHSFLHDTTSEV